MIDTIHVFELDPDDYKFCLETADHRIKEMQKDNYSVQEMIRYLLYDNALMELKIIKMRQKFKEVLNEKDLFRSNN